MEDVTLYLQQCNMIGCLALANCVVGQEWVWHVYFGKLTQYLIYQKLIWKIVSLKISPFFPPTITHQLESFLPNISFVDLFKRKLGKDKPWGSAFSELTRKSISEKAYWVPEIKCPYSRTFLKYVFS